MPVHQADCAELAELVVQQATRRQLQQHALMSTTPLASTAIAIPVPLHSADLMEKSKPVVATAAKHANGLPKKPHATAAMKPNPSSLALAATSLPD